MNDLINELKNDAVDWVMDNLDPDLNDFEWEKAIDKKFAELIVRECALLCSDPVAVLEHFGYIKD